MLGVEALADGVDFQMRLNTARYEAECGDAMLATLGPITALLDALKLTREDVDKAVLAGGSALIPKLRDGFYTHLNKTPEAVGTINAVDPSEAVVLGCAIHAAQLFLKSGNLTVPTQVTERNGGDPMAAPATPSGISVEVEGGLAVELVPANAVLPLNMSFYATADEDGSFALTLLGGSKPKASDNVRMLELCQQASSDVASKDVKVSVSIDDKGSVTASATFVEYNEEGEELNVGAPLEGACMLVSNGNAALNEVDVSDCCA